VDLFLSSFIKFCWRVTYYDHLCFSFFLAFLPFPWQRQLSFFVKSLSDTFFGDALIKLYETLQEYHMPCEVVHLRVDFFQNGCRCHGNGKNSKKK
jgi:hypothetical protein